MYFDQVAAAQDKLVKYDPTPDWIGTVWSDILSAQSLTFFHFVSWPTYSCIVENVKFKTKKIVHHAWRWGEINQPAVWLFRFCFSLLKFLIFIQNILFIFVITDY